MFDLFRRVLWYAPTFGLVATVWFVLLGRTVAAGPHEFPLALGLRPKTLASEAEAARRALFTHEPGARARIAALGGAALPSHLRALPGLPLSEQNELADALLPVLRRMGLTDDFVSATSRLERGKGVSDPRVLLKRFEEDHLTEFREALVERIVRRVATAESRARLADLELVDTFALPFLVRDLGRVTTSEDVARVARLSASIARVLPGSRPLRPGATVHEARLASTHIRRLWDHRSADFAEEDPLTRIGLPLAQTELAVWLKRAYREASREDEPLLLGRLVDAAKSSAALALAFLFGAILLAPMLAALARLLELDRKRALPIVPGARYVLAAALVGSLVAISHPPREPRLLFLVSLVVGAVPATFVLDRDLNDRIDHRMRHVLAGRHFVRRLGAIARLVGPSLPVLVPLLVAEAFVAVSLIEYRTGREGLGLATLDALRSSDSSFLFGVSLALSLATTLAHLLADALLSPLEMIRRTR